MFEDDVINSVSRLFNMPCVEYSGQKKKGGVIYLTYDDIAVTVHAETSQLIVAYCTLMVVSIDGREAIGFLTGRLFDFDGKDEDIKIEAIDQKESRNWLSSSTFETSKQIRISRTIDYNQSREQIKHFNLNEG